jgi:aspartate-semialdehyde dehydrogenase
MGGVAVKRFRTCILGATGIVGQHFIRILHGHPFFEIIALTASPRSQGLEFRNATDWIVSESIPPDVYDMIVQETHLEKILKQDPDIIFSALPSDAASDIESQLAREGLAVFSNAGAHRMEQVVPILVPEVNPDHLGLVNHQDYGTGFIITNSNCSTSGLVMVLRPLVEYGIRNITVTTFQAVSGAGRRGVSSMDILGNVIPFIAREEEKIAMETCKILGRLENGRVIPAKFDVDASCTRVPVMNGHLESVVVEFEEPVSLDIATKAMSDFTGEPQALNLPTAPLRPLIVMQEHDRPQPKRDLSLSEPDLGMAVKVGRLRGNRNRLSMFLLVHNTIRGAAGASVLNAEFARAKGVLK